MKIIFPHGGATREEIEELLRFAIEGRKRVKDQLMRIDSTYAQVNFAYVDAQGQSKTVKTLEEEEYPNYYYRTVDDGEDENAPDSGGTVLEPTAASAPAAAIAVVPGEQHLTYQENQKGISYDSLFGLYLRDATHITVTDPYIRLFYQQRNFMEFLETVVRHKAAEAEVAVHLTTIKDEFNDSQEENFTKMQESAAAAGVAFTWEFDGTGTIHARHIVTDHGWKISLDRGLDIFQHYEMKDAFTFSNRLQQQRQCKAFEVTCIRTASA